jgi:hypothetical protein
VLYNDLTNAICDVAHVCSSRFWALARYIMPPAGPLDCPKRGETDKRHTRLPAKLRGL